MNAESETDKLQRFKTALEHLIARVAEDRYILAVVLVGSLSEDTIWHRESIGLWIIESDGVTRRLRSDGNEERIHRILVEDGVNMHAEIIPRSRFKQMVEGASRTAFSCNFFAERKIVYCTDSSIANWFEQAQTVAIKDQERELLAFSSWTIHAHRQAKKRLEIKKDVELASQEVIWAAHSVAYTEIVRVGQVCEDDVIYQAIEFNPSLFKTIYLDVLSDRVNPVVLNSALDRIEQYLTQNYVAHLKPLLSFLKKSNRVVPLSEISDHFAYSEVYPWHLESACEWLEQRGLLQKLSAPFKLTKRSLEHVEEPAYLIDV
ncbi:MAG: hypothetical protein ABL921_00360 [Pirellula sp.]